MKDSPPDKETRSSRQAYNGYKQTSFLPEPKFNPRLPTKDTLEYKALYLMLQGQKISHRDFDNLTHSWRLAVYILKLRKLGWPIEDEIINSNPIKFSKTRFIKRYFLSSLTLKLAKDMGVSNG